MPKTNTLRASVHAYHVAMALSVGLLSFSWLASPTALAQIAIKPIPTLKTPTAVLMSADSRFVYVTNQGAKMVSVIDTKTNKVINKINVGNEPTAIVMTPNGKKIYVANRGDNTVSVIVDARSNRPIRTIEIEAASFPAYLAVTPDGNKLFVSNVHGAHGQQSGNVTVVDVKTDRVRPFPIDSSPLRLGQIGCPEGIAIIPNSTIAYLNTQCTGDLGTMGHDPIFLINTKYERIFGLINFADFPNVGSGVAASPDGKTVWASGSNVCTAAGYDHTQCPPGKADPITIIDTATHTIRKQLFLGAPAFISFTPDGRYVYLSTPKEIAVIDTETYQQIKTIPLSGSSGSVAFTRDGKFAYVPLAGIDTVVAIKIN